MVEVKKSQNKVNELSFLIWNVECCGGSGYGNNALLPNILNGIDIYNENVKPDIIMLNEFWRCDDYSLFEQALVDADYSVFNDSRKRKKNTNEVFIAISNKLKDIEIIDIIQPSEENCDNMPDLLSVILQWKGKRIAIVGTRIRWYGHVSEQVMKLRARNFSELLRHIDELKRKGIEDIYIGGDFNHCRVLDESAFLSEGEIQEVYKGYLQKDYNYHTIKLEFAKRGFQVITPINEFGSVKNSRSGVVRNAIKLDHLIVPASCKIINKEYMFKKGSSHAVLTATITI